MIGQFVGALLGPYYARGSTDHTRRKRDAVAIGNPRQEAFERADVCWLIGRDVQ